MNIVATDVGHRCGWADKWHRAAVFSGLDTFPAAVEALARNLRALPFALVHLVKVGSQATSWM